MDVKDVIEDNGETLTKILYALAGASVGGLVMGFWKNHQIKNLCEEIDHNTIDRLKTMSGLFNKVNEIMQNPLTTGEQKDAMVALAFVEMIVQQPII